jgi:hypothetical protein
MGDLKFEAWDIVAQKAVFLIPSSVYRRLQCRLESIKRKPGGRMMSDWTEYNSTMEWPEGDNFKWEVRLDGAWTETDTPFDDWDTGLRVRYREREPEMPKLILRVSATTAIALSEK